MGAAMNREDIERMAREAGLHLYVNELTEEPYAQIVERFAHLVYESVFRDANLAASRTILDAAVLEEREACAKVCDALVADTPDNDPDKDAIGACAAAIRARSNP
jgi:hypothetical protein